MTLIARFSRAGTDDTTLESEVEDIVFDFDCVEDATTDRTVARVERMDDGRHVFVPVHRPPNTWFDTLTVAPKWVPTLVVAFEATDQDGNAGSIAFVFTNENEADQFAAHVRDLYGIKDAVVVQQGIDTYDSAIQALVDAIGPSPE